MSVFSAFFYFVWCARMGAPNVGIVARDWSGWGVLGAPNVGRLSRVWRVWSGILLQTWEHARAISARLRNSRWKSTGLPT